MGEMGIMGEFGRIEEDSDNRLLKRFHIELGIFRMEEILKEKDIDPELRKSAKKTLKELKKEREKLDE